MSLPREATSLPRRAVGENACARVDGAHPKVVFLVRSLEIGGSERQLVILARALHERGVPVTVVAYYEGGPLGSELSLAGVAVQYLGKKGRWDVLSFCVRLAQMIRRERPVVLHSYLDVSNLLALLMKPLLRQTRIVWGVRASNVALSHRDWLDRAASKLEARFARHADRIIVNSWAGKAFADARGIPENKMVVVPNGIDTDYFRFDPVGRRTKRLEWGIADGDCLIGLAARFNPVKDHATFLEAARRLAARHPRARFVCVGDGPTHSRSRLRDLADMLGLQGRLVWAGMQHDMPAVYSAFDIACSSSTSEGFPNAVGEAMACERTCVVTDVGDSARIVGETGLVVPAGDFAALADAWLRQATLPQVIRQSLGAAARARVVVEFGVERLARETMDALSFT